MCLGDKEEALNYYQELLSISTTITERNKRMYAMATSLVAIGFIKSKLSDKDKKEAIILLTEAYDLLESVDMNFSASGFNLANPDHPTVVNYRALTLEYLGNIFCDQNKPREGLNRYLDALKLFELGKEIRFPSIMLINYKIGNIYKNLGEIEEAERYYLFILQLNQEYESNFYLLKSEKFLLK